MVGLCRCTQAFSSGECGAALCCVWASHCSGFSWAVWAPVTWASVVAAGALNSCGSWALRAQAQYLWLTGLVAPWHVASSQTRDRTDVPCIARWSLNHWTTREALWFSIFYLKLLQNSGYIALCYTIVQYILVAYGRCWFQQSLI